MSSLQVFTTHVICKYFFPVCVFVLFPVLLEEDTLILMKSGFFIIFSFMPHHAFSVVHRKFLPNPSSQIFSLVISSRSFRVVVLHLYL